MRPLEIFEWTCICIIGNIGFLKWTAILYLILLNFEKWINTSPPKKQKQNSDNFNKAMGSPQQFDNKK